MCCSKSEESINRESWEDRANSYVDDHRKCTSRHKDHSVQCASLVVLYGRVDGCLRFNVVRRPSGRRHG